MAKSGELSKTESGYKSGGSIYTAEGDSLIEAIINIQNNKTEEDELRWESRLRSQLAKGVSPKKLEEQAKLRQQKLQNINAISDGEQEAVPDAAAAQRVELPKSESGYKQDGFTYTVENDPFVKAIVSTQGRGSATGTSTVRGIGFGRADRGGGFGGTIDRTEADRKEAGALASKLRLGEATDEDFTAYLRKIQQSYGYTPTAGSQEDMLEQVQSYLRSRQPKAETFAEQRAEERDPLSRLGNTVTGGAKQFAGGLSEAAASAVQNVGTARMVNILTGSRTPVDPFLIALTRPLDQKIAQAGRDTADKLMESGAADIAKAQEGLNPAGRFLVNAGVGVTQIAGDAAIGAVTGGGALIPMLVRSFGNGAQEARQKGYSEEQQMALGLANAATEYLSERLFGGNPVYDSDAGLVNKLVGKVVKNPKVMEFLAATPVETLNEGLEEIVSDILNPVAEWAITGNRPEYEVDQIIEDGAVGVLTAMIVNGGAAVTNRVFGGNHSAQNGQQHSEAVFGQEKTASVEETVSTYVDTDPSTHTPEQMERIKKYQGATDNMVLAFIKKWEGLKNPNYRKKIRIPIAEVTAQAAADIKAAVGIDTSGYEHALSGGALEHIELRHGAQGKADHSMANPNDIARMGYVLENYDSVTPVLNPDGTQRMSREYRNTDNTPAPLIQFSMQIDGTYYVVEAVPDTAAHQMRIVSAYLSKESGSTDQLLNMPPSGPQPTP